MLKTFVSVAIVVFFTVRLMELMTRHFLSAGSDDESVVSVEGGRLHQHQLVFCRFDKQTNANTDQINVSHKLIRCLLIYRLKM